MPFGTPVQPASANKAAMVTLSSLMCTSLEWLNYINHSRGRPGCRWYCCLNYILCTWQVMSDHRAALAVKEHAARGDLSAADPFSSILITAIMRADLESCRSGRTGRIRNPLYPQGYPGFESLALGQLTENPASAGFSVHVRPGLGAPFQNIYFFDSSRLLHSR